ncbi:MAG: glycosyltransferase family 4 protein [Deltaproteobacteria bacterium]|nr:glycosyltransferase family 4 protein [Deltaproteobacteria bacterium]
MPSNIRKIAVVIPKYGLVGGAEKFAFEMTERLAYNHQYDIHVFANRWQSNSRVITFHKVPVINFPKFLTTISFAYFAGRKISSLGFDLIHAHDRIFDADIFTMHGLPHHTWVRDIRKKHMSLFDRGTQWVEKKLVNNERCNRFIAVSSLAKEIFLGEYDITPEKIQVLHPGVDIERYGGRDREVCRQEVRHYFGLNANDMVIVFVAMNFDIKGLDYVMTAIGRFKELHPDRSMKLLIVGRDKEKKYKKLARDLEISQDVIFTGVQKENIEKIYMASDIFMMLSRFDTFGITVLEAMAASLPVIISDHVGARDIVRNGINGFIIEDNTDTKRIAQTIAILSDKKIRTKMAQEAHITASNNSWDMVSRRMNEIYETFFKKLNRLKP